MGSIVTAQARQDRDDNRIAFRDVVVDFNARTLERGGQPVHVEPQVLDVLRVLVEHKGAVVSKLELLDRVWGDRFVSPATLTSRVRDLRAAVGDSGDQQHTIRTAHGRGFAFVADVLRPADTAPGTVTAVGKPLIGRAAELTAVRDRLSTDRLTTLVGPGGAGKTHLMRHAVSDREAVISELAAARDAAAVERTVLAALGGTERADGDHLGAITALLCAAPTLLVLDNCEHVIDHAVGLTRRLLDDCPTLTVLATSRRPLGLAEEVVVRIGPLAPDDAVALMIDHAQRHGIELDASDRTVSSICERLDHMPLAIELAASKSRAVPLPNLSSMLDDRFSLLTSDRADVAEHHRSLDGAIAWSVDLLDDHRRDVLRHLSVFGGSFTLDDAAAIVATTSAAAVDDLLALTDLSLVSFDPRRGTYHLIESIRLFAEGLGLDDDIRERHAQHVIERLEGSPTPGVDSVAEHLRGVRNQWPDLRQAAAFTRRVDAAALTHRLIAATWPYADQTYTYEVLEWCDDVIARDHDAGRTHDPETHRIAATLATHRGDVETAAKHVALAADAPDPATLALTSLWWQYSMGDIDAADQSGETIRTRDRGRGTYAEIVGLIFCHFLDFGAERTVDPRDVERAAEIHEAGDELARQGMELCSILRLDWATQRAEVIERLSEVIEQA
ncbi:MAG: winged helix-turn-helix domain-containing protein, partial [Actinomycetota bacterium]